MKPQFRPLVILPRTPCGLSVEAGDLFCPRFVKIGGKLGLAVGRRGGQIPVLAGVWAHFAEIRAA